MLRFLTLACIVLIAAVGAAQEPTRSRKHGKTPTVKDRERLHSVFDDQVKRFRFKIEGVIVTVDEAEAFMVRLGSKREEIGVIGAYPDYRTNSLFVVAAPEAEYEIRKQLADWIVQNQGFRPPSLKAQRRQLAFKRSELLREMAEIEVASVGIDKNRAAQLNDRNDALREELDLIEQQMQVVQKYEQRMTKKSAAAKSRKPRETKRVTVQRAAAK